ncbi:MAG: hypothetical protein ACK4MV_09325 [Beijerinckiaceae bacterium]
MQEVSWRPPFGADELELAELRVAEAKAELDAIAAIDKILIAIELMQRHIGRMDTSSEYAERTRQRARLPGRTAVPEPRPLAVAE